MRCALPLTLIFGLISNTSFADSTMCSAQQQTLNTVGSKYKPQFDQEQQEGDDIKKSAAQFNITITWDNVDIIFGLPTVTIRNQDIILGLPQVAMRTQDIIFSTPSIRMERHQTGEYPEVTCDHAFIPSCTVHWSPIYTDVPVPFMQEQHVKMDVPVFTFGDTKITIGVPEFSMQQQRWVVGLPQFRLDSVYINSGEIKDRSDALQAKIGNTRSAMFAETASDIHSLFDCQRQALLQQRADADIKFTSGLIVMDAVIQAIRTQGGDPTKLPDGSNLVDQRSKLNDQRVAALAKFDDALAKLNQSEKDAIAGLGGASVPAASGSAVGVPVLAVSGIRPASVPAAGGQAPMKAGGAAKLNIY